MTKEGDVSLTFSTAGTSDALAVSQGTMQINYVTNGVSFGSGGHALEETGGLHCVGSLTVVQGKFDNESGMCVLTMADGSKTMSRYAGSGQLGGTAEGTWEYLGGTGRFEGLSGSGTWARAAAPAPTQGMVAAITNTTGSFKLP